MSDDDSEGLDRLDEEPRRAVLMWKAGGLSIAMAVIGVALVVVLWLLVTLTLSLLGSL